MTEVLYATLFLVCFALLAGVVMYLSKTIEHGEARFDSSGKMIRDDARPTDNGPARPAQRIENIDTTTKVKDDE